MSDLQVSLLIIGAIVVGGVTAFNWFQQWRLRRKLEDAFGEKPEDVLLRPAVNREPAERVEPHFYAPHPSDVDREAEFDAARPGVEVESAAENASSAEAVR